ncbi:DUF2680 domain-containing protein [Carboxydothermus pertinax]|uniref:Uncharacterized protein n=1 Tax=Carboxydothermus pertinax TaxID=870242 RepID=A0A1L8CTF3_9THEO|nr:DUF2680 domain-containing protein [Carboxydothermus pertinax]GAV22187.1 hypothetical protein cpu_06970 [Carboxydothermus pertinax]
MKKEWGKKVIAGATIIGLLVTAAPAVYAATTNDGSTSTTSKIVETYRGFGKHFGRAFGGMMDNVAKFLGIDVSTLMSERHSGKTLAQIAKEKGKTEDELVNYLVEQKKAKINQLVKDGKITQAQADAMLQNITERTKQMVNSVDLGPKGFGHRGFGVVGPDELASFLGINVNTLISQQQSGKTLVEIAKAKGKTETELINFIVTKEKEKINQLVKDGKITQTQADNFLKNIETRVKNMVNSTALGPKGFGHRGGFRVTPAELASFLGIDVNTLISQQQSGKTLVEIAKAKGKTETELINFIVTKEKEKINQLVKDGKITQTQADNFLKNIETRVKQMVNNTAPGPKGFGHHGGMVGRGGMDFDHAPMFQ